MQRLFGVLEYRLAFKPGGHLSTTCVIDVTIVRLCATWFQRVQWADGPLCEEILGRGGCGGCGAKVCQA
jgi:hypothetical protein